MNQYLIHLYIHSTTNASTLTRCRQFLHWAYDLQPKALLYYILMLLFQIRRMQDMLTQMQEKLKAKGHGLMFKPQLSSPKADGDNKRDSIVNV